jgi:hypothetical protein
MVVSIPFFVNLYNYQFGQKNPTERFDMLRSFGVEVCLQAQEKLHHRIIQVILYLQLY